MRRKLAWVLALLVVAALAVPAAAAPRASSSITGTILNAATGKPFDAGLIIVDAFNVASMSRTAIYSVGADGSYTIGPLEPGDYKVRFRVFDASTRLLRYRWHDDKASFAAATPVAAPAGGSVTVDATLAVMRGAPVSGVVKEKGTGAPLGGDCFYVEVFETSGISIGVLFEVDVTGAWASYGKVPAGRLAAFAGYSPYPAGCETGPSHLDTWFGGASGYPFHTSNLAAAPAPFATADRFTVLAGVPVAAIDIEMPPAPTCRGRRPTIYGTTLADTINGTAARDIISALGGADVVNGLAGNDLICGDAGNDTLTGGVGLRDTAVGGPGAADVCSAETVLGCELTP